MYSVPAASLPCRGVRFVRGRRRDAPGSSPAAARLFSAGLTRRFVDVVCPRHVLAWVATLARAEEAGVARLACARNDARACRDTDGTRLCLRTRPRASSRSADARRTLPGSEALASCRAPRKPSAADQRLSSPGTEETPLLEEAPPRTSPRPCSGRPPHHPRATQWPAKPRSRRLPRAVPRRPASHPVLLARDEGDASIVSQPPAPSSSC